MGLPGRALGPAAARRMSGRPGNVRSPLVYRLAPLVTRPPHAEADPLTRPPAVARLEAALFAAEGPLTGKQLAGVARLPASDVAGMVSKLNELYDLDRTAFQVVPIAGGYQLLTRPEFHAWLARARRPVGEPRLSAALLETLAVVAYRQPVTRADVEQLRAASAGEHLRQLMERGLVRPAGRQNTLGRPQLYATTRKFLQLFGLTDCGQLPPVDAGTPPAPPAPARDREAVGAG